MLREWIEVSAVRQDASGFETCNDDTGNASAVGVYLRTPEATHVRDFPVPLSADGFGEAAGDALEFAAALGGALGWITVARFPRFVAEPQRDLHADIAAPPGIGTRWERCEEREATQWAVYAYAPDAEPGDAELLEDYPSRALADAAVAALYRGERAPPPPAFVPAAADLIDIVRRAFPFVAFHEGSETPDELEDLPTLLGDMRRAIGEAEPVDAAPTEGGSAADALARHGFTREAIDRGGFVMVRRFCRLKGAVAATIIATDADDSGKLPTWEGWALHLFHGEAGALHHRWKGAGAVGFDGAVDEAARLARALTFGGAL